MPYILHPRASHDRRVRPLWDPAVAIDCYDDKTQWNAVHLDNYGGAYDATSYLLESGHRQIGLLSGGDEWPSGVYRKRVLSKP